MKYIKLIAKPNTWFKEGTEVFDYDAYYDDKRRITLDSFKKDWEASGMILVRGIRVNEKAGEDGGSGKVGDERIDGELCGIDEFEATIIDNENK